MSKLSKIARKTHKTLTRDCVALARSIALCDTAGQREAAQTLREMMGAKRRTADRIASRWDIA